MSELPDNIGQAVVRSIAQSGFRRVAVGSVWIIGARWAIRSLGLINTVILARLLRPQDFGLFAMGAMTVQFVLAFANAGQAMAIIRNVDATDEHFDTAWTMSVIIGVAVAAVLIAGSPLAGWYFHEPRAVGVVQAIALKPLIDGFTNVGVLKFQKDMQFHKDFQFLVIQKLAPFLIAVSLVWVLRSYWLLIIAILAGAALSVAASYWLSSYRPRFRLTRFREIRGFSIWMQIANIGTFLGSRGDEVVVGGLVGTRAMGLYNVAADSASTATDEIIVPMTRVLLAYYSRLFHEPARLAEAYLSALSFIAAVALSTGVGIALVARDLVRVVLGEQWLAAVPLVYWLSLGSAVFGVSRSVDAILTATGNGRLYALRSWLFVALMVPAAVIGTDNWGPVGAAAARAIVTILFAPIMFGALIHVLPITVGDIWARLWRPLIAAAAMYVAVELSNVDAVAIAAVRLLLTAGIGATVFVFVLISLWSLTGRGPGVERMVVDQAVRLWRQLRGQKASRADETGPQTRV